MPTGYGYVRDSEPLAVDWSAVSKKFTDQLKTQEEQRLATKKDILDKRTEFTKTLLNKPVGQNTALNRIMSGFADQLREYSLTNLDDFKAKNKDLKAYNAWENNAKSGTDLLFEAVESFNTNFDNYAKRAQDGTASQIEVFMHELTQDYTDFGSVSLDVDPKTGEVIISELGEDGNPTGKTLDVSQLGYFSKFTRDKYNIDTEVGNIAKGLGTKFLQDSEGNSLKYQGMLYEEIVNNDELMKGLDTEISALIDEGFELESVLADSLNYSIVTDKTDDETKLFFNQDTNQFEISETQKKAAFDHVKQKLMNALNIDRRDAPAEKPKDKTRETIDIINTVRLAGGKVDPKLFTQLLKDLGLDDKQIADTFPDGIDDNSFAEFNADLTGFVAGITSDTLNQAVSDGKPGALTNQLRKLRQLGIGANYEDASKLDKSYAEQNNQPKPLGFISINALNGDDEDAFRIPLTQGLDILDLYDEIVSQIPIYASPADIAFRLEMISERIKGGKNRPPGDILFMPKN